MKKLIADGADVDAKDSKGNTVLMIAAFHGHQDIVKALIDAKADVHEEQIMQWNALDYAALQGHQEIEEILKKHGVERNIRGDLAQAARYTPGMLK